MRRRRPEDRRRTIVLALTALGVVFGDIGTSPLYALRECFSGPHGLPPTPANVLGVLSLMVWSLIVVISFKYLTLVMRANNHGEGGVLALLALVQGHLERRDGVRRWAWLLVLGLFAACLLYGDGMITPAISVLSAIEGLSVATHVFEPYVLPLTVAILVALFWVQHKGTASVGGIFGPVILVWFVVLVLLGLPHVVAEPHVLAALSPTYAVAFFVHNGWHGFIVLGAVFLVVTGGEALYADMGHFGAGPIRIAWFALVLPALLVNYFGQGALLLADPAAARNPFYLMAPGWALYPLVGIATVATVIASQAVISGAFSLTRQAIQLGYAPRLRIEHTSTEEIGQVYVPAINWLLMLATLGLVVGFGTSSNLAAAYGVAVSTTMVVTTLLAFVVMLGLWRWPLWAALPLSLVLLTIDTAFMGANLLKIGQGGWFPLLVGGLVYVVFSTWRTGRRLLAERLGALALPLPAFLEDLERHPVHRVPGTAVFMTGSPEGTPVTLLHHIKHNKVLHETVVLLTIVSEEVPYVAQEERVVVRPLQEGFWRVYAHYGFMEMPDVPEILELCRTYDLEIRLEETTFYLGIETLLLSSRPGMARWRKQLFRFLSRNAQRATDFFRIPPNRVVELGVQIEL